MVVMVVRVVTGGHDGHGGHSGMVIRKGQTSQIRQRGQTDLKYKLDFPGNLRRAAFCNSCDVFCSSCHSDIIRRLEE